MCPKISFQSVTPTQNSEEPKIPFKYKIVAGSSSIAKQYGASAYPTHIIINKQGLVEFTITGGSPDIQENLRPLIRGLLK